MTVEVPAESMAGKPILQIEGVETEVKLEPFIRKIVAEVPPPTLADPRSDARRLLASLEKRFALIGAELSLGALQKLPAAMRKGGWTISLTLWGNEIIDVEPGVKEATLGFALDLGTSKLAGYLVDLRTGRILSVSPALNPQIRFGEDVVSRVSHALREGVQDLQRSAIEAISRLIGEACGEARASRENVYEMVVVGNTAMHHFFLGLPTNYLAHAPYPTVVQGSLDLKARELSIAMSPEGNVHALPTIAGFVGADAVGAVLSTEIYKSDVLTLAMDIGTNTEILLGDRNGLMVCSAASGPAFEGSHIEHGVRAANGAIEKIEIDPSTIEVSYRVIGGGKPRGLCGSALVDAVAEALKAGVVDRSGRMNLGLGSPRIRDAADGSPEFVIAWKHEASTGEDITLTQKDIRELQLAKAAIFAGVRVLMRKRKVGREDLAKVLIAGAFGTRTDPGSAKAIGMFPSVPLRKVKHVGNAAGSGARMALVSRRARRLAGELARKVRYVELAADPEFQKEFLDAVPLPHGHLKWF